MADSHVQPVETDVKESDLSEGQLLARRKERKKRRQERLIQGLEIIKKDKEEEASNQQEIENSEPPRKKSKKKKKNKSNEKPSAFEEQLAKDPQLEISEADEGRRFTLSLALPGSILGNAQSGELRTYLAGQIARALAVFSVDEVIVFDDEGKLKLDDIVEHTGDNGEDTHEGSYHKKNHCVQLARILQFLECPQYLRKAFFPIHPDLKYAGVLNPTDMPHHFRIDEVSKYREGVVTKTNSKTKSVIVDVGLKKDCHVSDPTNKLSEGLRVTVELDLASEEKNLIQGKVVAPSTPRTRKGLYWGYNVRLVEKLSQVFTKSPFKGGYDLTLGTSERGDNIDNCQQLSKPSQINEPTQKDTFRHLLVVLGGVKGLEWAVENDDQLKGEVSDPSKLFDIYLNTCPNQGSRTIRTEEALLITLAALRPKIIQAQNQSS